MSFLKAICTLVTPEPTLVAGHKVMKLEQHYSQLRRYMQDCSFTGGMFVGNTSTAIMLPLPRVAPFADSLRSGRDW